MSKTERKLEQNIFDLSALLTRERNGIRGGYFTNRSSVQAYIAYFHQWNLLRLAHAFRVFGINENSFNLKDGDFCMDIGSGPLTFVQALWLNFPALQKKRLTWYCIDRSKQILDAGEDLFLHLVASSEDAVAWRIVKLVGDENTSVRQKCSLVSCVNSLNEIALEKRALRLNEKRAFLSRFLSSLAESASENAKYFFFEPGTPPAFENLSVLRELVLPNAVFEAPCTHNGECACARHGKRWCNFTFSAETAPKALTELSKKAHLEKERISFSILFFALSKRRVSDSPKQAHDSTLLSCRIISEPFNVPRYGKAVYACSSAGLVLLYNADSQAALESAGIVEAALNQNAPRDKKSGAIILSAHYRVRQNDGKNKSNIV